MALPSLAELWQGVRRQLFPRWVLVALDEQGLVIQEWKPGRRSATPVWQLHWPQGLCERGRPTNTEALGAFVGDFLIEQDIVAAHVLASLPPACTHWRVVEGLGDEPGSWLQQMQAQEPLLRFPSPLEQLQLNLRPLQTIASRKLMVAADRVAVDGWIEVFAQAGLSLDRLEPVQLCWMDALIPQLRSQEEQEALVLLHSSSDGGVWLVVWCGLEPVYQERLQGEAVRWMPELDQRLQALMRHRHVQRFSLVWDGPSDGLMQPKPERWPPLSPAPLAEFGSLALAGLVRSEVSKAGGDR